MILLQGQDATCPHCWERITLTLPDLEDDQKNRKLEAALADLAERIAQLIR